MENSKKKDAKEKLRELAGDIRICMMVTGWGKQDFCAVPMTTKKIDASGAIWFLSLKNSEHQVNIAENDRVELLYSDPTKMEFLSISGMAKIHTDQSILEELYDEDADVWFEDANDPRLSAIEVVPDKAYYWDTQTNKYEALYHLGIATITGEEKHSGDKGELRF